LCFFCSFPECVTTVPFQDEEVGDGTTSVIVLAGEYLNLAGPLLERQVHPTTICNGYLKALDDAVKVKQQQTKTQRES